MSKFLTSIGLMAFFVLILSPGLASYATEVGPQLRPDDLPSSCTTALTSPKAMVPVPTRRTSRLAVASDRSSDLGKKELENAYKSIVDNSDFFNQFMLDPNGFALLWQIIKDSKHVKDDYTDLLNKYRESKSEQISAESPTDSALSISFGAALSKFYINIGTVMSSLLQISNPNRLREMPNIRYQYAIPDDGKFIELNLDGVSDEQIQYLLDQLQNFADVDESWYKFNAYISQVFLATQALLAREPLASSLGLAQRASRFIPGVKDRTRAEFEMDLWSHSFNQFLVGFYRDNDLNIDGIESVLELGLKPVASLDEALSGLDRRLMEFSEGRLNEEQFVSYLRQSIAVVSQESSIQLELQRTSIEDVQRVIVEINDNLTEGQTLNVFNLRRLNRQADRIKSDVHSAIQDNSFLKEQIAYLVQAVYAMNTQLDADAYARIINDLQSDLVNLSHATSIVDNRDLELRRVYNEEIAALKTAISAAMNDIQAR